MLFPLPATSCLPNSQSAFEFYVKDPFLLKALLDSQIGFTLSWGSDPPSLATVIMLVISLHCFPPH